jgi:hypothetical protein
MRHSPSKYKSQKSSNQCFTLSNASGDGMQEATQPGDDMQQVRGK